MTMDQSSNTPREPLLVEREKTHGSYELNAGIAQQLKAVLRHRSLLWTRLDGRQQESLDLICTKIGRIMSGNNLEIDHWNDIAGYAKLGGEACE